VGFSDVAIERFQIETEFAEVFRLKTADF